MSTPRRIIIDCDPGVDDAVAILLAFAAPEAVEVVAITTVIGNVSLPMTTANALRVRDLAGRGEVPVHSRLPPPHHGACGAPRSRSMAATAWATSGCRSPPRPSPLDTRWMC